MIENCPMRHENGNCIPAGGFCTANKNICEALLNAYKMGKTQLPQEGTTSDLISRQAALDAVGKYASVWMEYTDAMSKDEIAQIALNNAKSTMIRILKEQPTVQHEPSILLSWVEKYIEWLKSFDNEFANLAAAHISVMVKKWRDEQDETD